MGGEVCQFWFSFACDEISLMCCSKVGSLRRSYSREPKNYVSGLVGDCLLLGATGCSRRSLRLIFRMIISPDRMDSSFTDSSVWSLTMLCTGCNCLEGDKLTLFPEECLMVILWNCCLPGNTSQLTFTWLILPVVICLSQRLSHACLSLS